MILRTKRVEKLHGGIEVRNRVWGSAVIEPVAVSLSLLHTVSRKAANRE
jgi:hypothetical protein